MKNWVQLLTATIQCFTAYLLLKDKKKGTKKKGARAANENRFPETRLMLTIQ
ncbi:hypothetical protein [Paenibacillus sp. FSL R10-2734]|uniref:hypothetical protein n=1 Tax=Paenibacillus sp. FSL R10-2734 TaxID=2954691 RepID=UPI0030DA6163